MLRWQKRCASPSCEVTAPAGAREQVEKQDNRADFVGGRGGGGAEGMLAAWKVLILKIPTCCSSDREETFKLLVPGETIMIVLENMLGPSFLPAPHLHAHSHAVG